MHALLHLTVPHLLKKIQTSHNHFSLKFPKMDANYFSGFFRIPCAYSCRNGLGLLAIFIFEEQIWEVCMGLVSYPLPLVLSRSTYNTIL